jgi:hypothetical protein
VELLYEVDRHLPEIQQAVSRKTANYAKIIESVGSSRQPAVTTWLRQLLESTDAVTASSARGALMNTPRAEAADLYVTWLEQAIGKHDVSRLLKACMAVRAGGALPLLPRVLAAPPSAKAYRLAVEMDNDLGKRGEAMPTYLLAAEEIIRKYNHRKPQARQALDKAVELAASAQENTREAAIVGVELTLTMGKIDRDDLDAMVNAGTQILRKLPNGEGPRLLRLLIANGSKDEQHETHQLQKVLAAVEKP